MSACQPLVTTFPSTDQYLNWFYACFCLKTLYAVHIVGSLAWSSWPAAHAQAGMYSARTWIFSLRHITTFLGLETPGGPSAPESF